MATKDSIVQKALRCIDEAYPDVESNHAGYFPIDTFFEEALRWVIDAVPAHVLEEGTKLAYEDVETEDGIVTLYLDEPLDGRLIFAKVVDWKHHVTDIIYDTDPRYRQQSNKVLRGNPTRPIVAVTYGGKRIEMYSTSKAVTSNDDIEAYYIPYGESGVAYLPGKLEDITAWKLAEVVLMASSDVQAASVCTAKVNEHLQQLSL